VLHIPTLRRWFPEAKFIHLVRDPRAVVNSWRSVPWSSGYRWRDAEVWVEHVQAGRKAEARFPAQVMSLHFEMLVQSPAEGLKEICDFLNVSFDEQMLAFHERTTETVDVVREPWKERATDPVDSSVAHRWRKELSRSAQAQVEAVAASEMKHWGYPCEVAPLRRRVAGLRAGVERPVWKFGLILDKIRSCSEPNYMSAARSDQLHVGFLHVGNPEHGVTRYGRVLAEAAREHSDMLVREAAIEWKDNPASDAQQLREAIRTLGSADVVHVQYNERVWGEGIRTLINVFRFATVWNQAMAVTVHDVRDGYGPFAILRRLKKQSTWFGNKSKNGSEGREKSQVANILKISRGFFSSSIVQSAAKGINFVVQEVINTLATLRLSYRSGRILVCTNEEARRLQALVGSNQLSVVPHFVEQRSESSGRESAKSEVGVEGKRVLGLLGYIHRRKGYDLVLEALPYLPDDIILVCIGRPGKQSQRYARQLQMRAEELGVASRLHITGYIAEDELDLYLAATDLALCPFREASASGSLSTWIAAERPVLAADLPLFGEYNERVPEAIATFHPYTPEVLAARIKQMLQIPEKDVQKRLRALRAKLSLPQVIKQHAVAYRRAVAERSDSLS
jgi:glycosyltransferase involved in cell wall biosynthesis